MSPKLKILSAKMSKLTAPVCAKECKIPHGCCDRMYCEIADETAQRQGVTLTRTDHPSLPFMSATVCGAAAFAHALHPACVLHQRARLQARRPAMDKSILQAAGQN
jgi:hypothetical protein